MTRSQFLRIALGVAAVSLTVSSLVGAQSVEEERRVKARLLSASYHPGSGSTGDTVGNNCGSDSTISCGSSNGGPNGASTGDAGGGGVGWGDGGTGGPGGNPGVDEHCNPHFPSPENDTILLGIIGGGAAFWPQLKGKIERFLK